MTFLWFGRAKTARPTSKTLYYKHMNYYRKPTRVEIEVARKILKKRDLGLLFMFLVVPAVGIFHTLTGSNPLSIFLGISFIIAIIVLMTSACLSNCPRCGKNFFTTNYLVNGFASKCVHCGLNGKIISCKYERKKNITCRLYGVRILRPPHRRRYTSIKLYEFYKNTKNTNASWSYGCRDLFDYIGRNWFDMAFYGIRTRLFRL